MRHAKGWETTAISKKKHTTKTTKLIITTTTADPNNRDYLWEYVDDGLDTQRLQSS